MNLTLQAGNPNEKVFQYLFRISLRNLTRLKRPFTVYIFILKKCKVRASINI